MGLFATLSHRARNVARSAEQANMALQELCNHLDTCAILPEAQLSTAVNSLEVSRELRGALPNAKIDASLVQDDSGLRIEASISWDCDMATKSISLVAWHHPDTLFKSKSTEAPK
jgi:hypothetical protein